jgi:hypothetical protein
MRYDGYFPSAKLHMTLSLIVHANSKVGKTTLGGTCPKPCLVLDAEGGSKFLPYAKTYWNPLTEAPPECDGSWEVCVVVVSGIDTLNSVYAWLITGQTCFASLVVDSISEVQRKLKEQLVGTEQMKMQDWGVLLTRMEWIIRALRDLTEHPTSPLSVVMFVAETRERNGKWKPYMQGQMEISLPYLVDLTGFLYVDHVQDPYDTLVMHEVRRLWIGQHPQFESGERLQGRLGTTYIDNPNVEAMLQQTYPQILTPISQETSS